MYVFLSFHVPNTRNAIIYSISVACTVACTAACTERALSVHCVLHCTLTSRCAY